MMNRTALIKKRSRNDICCGKEYSIKIDCFPYKIVYRKQGDVAVCYADPSKAKKELNWSARRRVEEICADLWHWQSSNPGGYAEDGGGI